MNWSLTRQITLNEKKRTLIPLGISSLHFASTLVMIGKEMIKKWWVTVLLMPFMAYQLHQAYWALNYNIFFSISYNFPFPVNIEKFVHTNILLIVHEAGHTFSSLLGNRFFTILGGSLYEILLPGLIAGFTLFNRYKKWSQYALYLLGTAWFSVAFYAADGSQRQLPLIGNLGSESHDWFRILHQLDLLHHDYTFGVTFATFGFICFLAAETLPLWFKEIQQSNIDLQL